MTVSYNLDVSRNSWTSTFKLLLRWRGSVWKSVWLELIVWLIFYYLIMFMYRSEWILNPDQQRTFELLQLHIRSRIDWIPLNFLLGFFVSMVVDRWRQIFNNLGFIENIALSVACLFRHKEEDDKHRRRAIVRWLCLSQVLVFRDISLKVRKRFPNMDSIVKSGFMEEHEKILYENVKNDFNKYWIPLNWAGALCMKARETGKLCGDNYLQGVLQELKNFRTSLALLCNYDWVPVPLAYPQLVVVAVRSYFILCLIARQYIIGTEAVNKSTLDLYFPFMTILQFVFYIGWMKIAQILLNPMGEDDDHFECNYLVDRNISLGLSIVDDTFEQIPEIVPDRFLEMPHAMYTESTAPKDGEAYSAFTGSVAHIVLAREDEDVDMVTVIPSDATADDEALIPPSRKTSFARFGSNMKKKFNRRDSKFTARVVPAGVIVTESGSGPSTPQRKRMAAVRRASEIPRGLNWRMTTDATDDDDDSLNGSFKFDFSYSRDSKTPFDKSDEPRRLSVPTTVITKAKDSDGTLEVNGITPKHSATRISDASRPPTICEEEEEPSMGSEESEGGSKGNALTITPTTTPTMMKKDRHSVTINTEPMEMKETSTPPMTPKGILKNKGEGSQAPSRAPSQPPSRDPHLAPVKEELSVAEAVEKVLQEKEKRLSQEGTDDDENKEKKEKTDSQHSKNLKESEGIDSFSTGLNEDEKKLPRRSSK